ncbi:MAG: nuclear transport factor 2 family protein [Tepidiformaceae bacterium]
MSNATAINVAETVDTYLASLGQSDPAARAAMIAHAWVPEGRYVDPARDVRGPEAMQATISAVQEQAPGASFRRTSGIDLHHEYLRFAWEMVGPDGAVLLAGIDIGSLSEDGKLKGICGFFGDLPAA